MFGGNLDLSVTMTAISTFAAFFMMPGKYFLSCLIVACNNRHVAFAYFFLEAQVISYFLHVFSAWIFSLGQHLILNDERYDIVIPYYKIAIYCFFLVIPLRYTNTLPSSFRRWLWVIYHVVYFTHKLQTLRSIFLAIGSKHILCSLLTALGCS